MGKLSKIELEAVSYEIRKQIINSKKEEIEEKKQELINSFYETDLGQKIKFINEHPDMKNKSGISNYTINQLAKVPLTNYPSQEEIKRKLVIEQIDCSNTEELIEKVKKSFLE